MKLLNTDIKEDPIDHATCVHLLIENYMQQTEFQLNKIKHNFDSKLSVFSHILDINNIPKFLSLISERAITKEVTKFCQSAHYCNIERGRYTKPRAPRNDRICPRCTLIETEIHFFTECHRYCIPRKKLYEDFDIDVTSTGISILSMLLNPKNRSKTFSLNTFIKVALQLRNNIYPVSILRKSISGRHRPVRVDDGPITARCRFT